jgi:hypothetical protein
MAHPFYPPQLLLHALLPTLPALEIFLLLHLYFAGFAMYRLLRAMGRAEVASATGATVWMLLGYGSMWFSTGILAGVSVWGPLAFLGLLRAVEAKDLSRAPLAGAAMGMAILGSHPQHALHLFLFLVGWLLVRRAPLRVSALFVLSAVGIGLAAILTRLDTLGNGWRAPGGDLEILYARPWNFPAYLASLVLGKVWFPREPHLEWEVFCYAGLAATALAAIGARDPRVRYVAVFTAAALVLPFLKPVAALLQVVPILNLSPATRWIFVAGFGLSILAAHGVDALGRRRWIVTGAALGLGAIVVLLPRLGPASVETGIGFTLAAGAAWAARRFPAAPLAAILFELLPPFVLQNWHADPSLLREPPPPIALAKTDEPSRATGLLRSTYSSRDSMLLAEAVETRFLCLYGVENPAGFTGILPAHTFALAVAAGGLPDPAGRAVVFTDLRSKLLDLMNLRHVFVPDGFPAPPPRYRLLGRAGATRVYENPQTLPRARIVPRARSVATEEEALKAVQDPGFDPRRETVILGAAPAGGGEGTVRHAGGAFKVSAGGPAFLVVADADYPGWEADVDGRPVPVLRADVAFRAVAVPAGESTVVFRFRPESARVGIAGSAVFLALALGYAVRLRRRPA